ncbi:hypothetical protein HC928_22755, partial [bacterium]|nr:hypothetical protein [bacterium]
MDSQEFDPASRIDRLLDAIELVKADHREEARSVLRELIRELGRTKTVLLSTHVLGEVEELCGRVLMLYGGRLLADGSLTDLTVQPPALDRARSQ